MREEIKPPERPWQCPDCSEYIVGSHTCPESRRRFEPAIGGDIIIFPTRENLSSLATIAKLLPPSGYPE